ncbi:MAG: methyltransferase domain-containing protein [Acidobacteria bacterium]|nr:methyltransferase domain-containing protein [Acidobacteriota bacterium]
MADHSLEFTGERLVPGQVDQDLLNEHLARYAFAARLARGKRVLDIASGAGYGSAELARVADQVTGIDISPDAVAAAAATYSLPNLRFLAAPAQSIPLKDGSIDLIVAFEVIEHLNDWTELLGEARRLLAPGGQFIVSTPNRDYYAESRRLHGPNPYHVHEFDYPEFLAELQKFFPHVSLFVQNHVGAISFHPASGHPTLVAELAQGHNPPDPNLSHFFLAVCALSPLTGSPFYLYVPTAANVLREREHHVLKLESELEQKNAWLEELKEKHAQLHTIHQQIQQEMAEHTKWALSLEQDLKTSQNRVVELQAEVEEQHQAAERAVEGYESKIAELDSELAARAAQAAALIEAHEELETQMRTKLDELARCVELLHQSEKLVEERTLWAQQLDERVKQLEQTLSTIHGSRWVKLGRTFGIGPDLQKY